MNFLLDLLLLVIVLQTVIGCTKRGFVKSVVHLVSMAVSFLAARAFTPKLALWLETEVFSERITGSVTDTIRSLARTAEEKLDLSRLFVDMPDDFSALLSRYGADASALSDTFGRMSDAGAAAADSMARAIAAPISRGIADVCAFILLFIAAMLACTIIGALLDLIVKLPVLRTANRLLGFLLGVLCAAILGWLFAEAAELVMRYLHTVNPDTFAADIIDHTLLVKYLCRTELLHP